MGSFLEKFLFLSISLGQAEYNLSMNKRWTDQKYAIYFLLSVMVLGVCGSVSYGLACCQTKVPRDKEAGLVKAAGEVDERYVPYRASEQRTIEIELLAYEDGGQREAEGEIERHGTLADGGSAEGERQAGAGAQTEVETAVTENAELYAEEDADVALPGGNGTVQDVAGAEASGSRSIADAGAEPQDIADAGMTAPESQDITDAGAAAESQDIADAGAAVPESQDNADAGAQTIGQAVAISAEDYEALLRIVQAEAGNEDTKGKILVANVVLNRVADARFPNTVYEVVFQRAGGRAQFSPVASGSYYKVVVSDDTREAVDRALAGEDYSEGALFFAARRYAGSSQMRWFDECLTKLFSYGGHEFFTS